MYIGANSTTLARWPTDGGSPLVADQERLAAVRGLVEDFGLSAVEVSLDSAIIFPGSVGEAFFPAVASLQKEPGFVLSMHLPFRWLDLASGNEAIRRASVDTIRRAIELAAPLRPTTYVLHPCGASTQVAAGPVNTLRRDAMTDLMRRQVSRSLGQIATLLPHRALCIETLEAPSWDMFQPAVVEHDLSICMDAGHLLWLDVDPVEFYHQHAARIREIHLHDVRALGDGESRRYRDHLPLGAGGMDFRALLDTLKTDEFQGSVILEVFSRQDLQQSVAALRRYLEPRDTAGRTVA